MVRSEFSRPRVAAAPRSRRPPGWAARRQGVPGLWRGSRTRIRGGPHVCLTRVGIADGDGEEFEDALRGLFVRMEKIRELYSVVFDNSERFAHEWLTFCRSTDHT
jgi:hypothetical protein